MPHDIGPHTTIHIASSRRKHAEDIATWRYDAAHDMAGVKSGRVARSGGWLPRRHGGGRLIGFRSFGPDGQVPGWKYDDSALDTGRGLRPELTGQDLGRAVISEGLTFGRARFAPAAFRVTVTSFNARALHTVASLGFERVGSFKASRDARTSTCSSVSKPVERFPLR